MEIQRAISIRQPFVELILRGAKCEEYRSQPTRIRERVYIYASLQPYASAKEWAKVERTPGELPVGLILGTVEIADCRPDAKSGGYAYVLRDPVRLAQPLKPLNQPQPVFWRPVFSDVDLGDRTRPEAAQRKGGEGQIKTGSRRSTPGAQPLFQPDAALAALVGPDALSQKELVSRLWAYITAHNLQDQQDKRVVNTDPDLHRLFGKARVSLDEVAFMLGEHVVEAPPRNLR